MRIKKIFLGLTEIASQLSIYKKAFERLGVEVVSVLCDKHIQHKDIKGNYDFVISDYYQDIATKSISSNKLKFRDYCLKKIFEQYLNECDVFLFMYQQTFLPEMADYPLLKDAGKKIIHNFCGTDIRYPLAMEQEFASFNMAPIIYSEHMMGILTLQRQIHFLRMAEKYADMIISLPNQGQLALRPYNNFFYPVDLEEISVGRNQRKLNPVVAHAPSNRLFKGTSHILNVFDRLKKEGLNFTPLLIENMTYAEAVKAYEDIDILVGQVLAPGGGKQAFELLASGKVVLSAMGNYKYPQFETEESCPIVDVNKDNLYDVLKRVILDYPLRKELSEKGRPYVEKYHNVYELANNMLSDLYSNINEHMHYPKFFRDSFIPKEGDQWICNQYNDFVKECSWYKEYVKSGVREGLLF